ncbi:MAG: hypothetical protein ACLRMN_09605 [Mediterraneibacter gnavus]
MSYFYPASITVLENLLIFQYSVYFRNQKNTRIALVVTGISTVVNLWFDFALVYGAAGFPHMGTAGANWGKCHRFGVRRVFIIIRWHIGKKSEKFQTM